MILSRLTIHLPIFSTLHLFPFYFLDIADPQVPSYTFMNRQLSQLSLSRQTYLRWRTVSKEVELISLWGNRESREHQTFV